jgi:uncharacterized protein HemX
MDMYQPPAPAPRPATDPLAALAVLLSLAAALAVGAAVYLWRREARKTEAAIAALRDQQQQQQQRQGVDTRKDLRALRADVQTLTSRLYDPKGLTFRINEQAQFNNDVYLGKDRRLCLTDGSDPVCLTNKDFAAVKAIKP